jgi:excisionase family DNA binding protein
VITDLPRLLTTEQAACALGLRPQTLQVWRSARRYDLPFVKSGRLVRYRETDVVAFIERRIRGAGSEAQP